jgi:hypothetical protein
MFGSPLRWCPVRWLADARLDRVRDRPDGDPDAFETAPRAPHGLVPVSTLSARARIETACFRALDRHSCQAGRQRLDSPPLTWATNSIGRVPCSQRGSCWFKSSVAHHSQLTGAETDRAMRRPRPRRHRRSRTCASRVVGREDGEAALGERRLTIRWARFRTDASWRFHTLMRPSST